MMWEFEYTATTSAKAATIWELYSDITSWVKWDQGIVHASLEGPFEAGVRGQIQPEGQERLAFVLTEVQPLQGFADVTDMPDAGFQIRFTHLLQQNAEGTSVTHKVTISGPNAEQLGPVIGAGMAEGIPHSVEGLVALALDIERQHAG